MSDIWLRRVAWGSAITALVILGISIVLGLMAASPSNLNWLQNQVRTMVTLCAPILGLIIVRRNTRHRIGWLWLFFAILVGLRSIGHAIYYYSGAKYIGYSDLEYFLLWFTEPANIIVIACLILLMLWFPDGKLVSRRWRFIYPWLIITVSLLILQTFAEGSNWNGGAAAGGIIIDNPYGWLPESMPFFIGVIPFLSIVLIMVISVVSLIFRYRSARQLVRLQIRWFVLGSILFIFLSFGPIFLIPEESEGVSVQILRVIGFSSDILLYLAAGIAILRYRLYDIDLIIRKTLQYTLLTGTLGLAYFGSVILLQTVVEILTGEHFPVVIVLSTLAIAALFNPLRIRIQDFIDRRFYRSRYNTELSLTQFSTVARNEVEIELLAEKLIEVVRESFQPEHIELQLINIKGSDR